MIDCGEACKAALVDRKFMMTIGAGIVDTILRASDKISESSYVTLTLATVAAFIVAHEVSGFINKEKENGPS